MKKNVVVIFGGDSSEHDVSCLSATTVIKTAIFAADGTQLSNLQKGINIIVKTFKDGSKKTSKVIVK